MNNITALVEALKNTQFGTSSVAPVALEGGLNFQALLDTALSSSPTTANSLPSVDTSSRMAAELPPIPDLTRTLQLIRQHTQTIGTPLEISDDNNIFIPDDVSLVDIVVDTVHDKKFVTSDILADTDKQYESSTSVVESAPLAFHAPTLENINLPINHSISVLVERSITYVDNMYKSTTHTPVEVTYSDKEPGKLLNNASIDWTMEGGRWRIEMKSIPGTDIVEVKVPTLINSDSPTNAVTISSVQKSFMEYIQNNNNPAISFVLVTDKNEKIRSETRFEGHQWNDPTGQQQSQNDQRKGRNPQQHHTEKH